MPWKEAYSCLNIRHFLRNWLKTATYRLKKCAHHWDSYWKGDKQSRSYTESAMGKDTPHQRCAHARGVATICGQKIGGWGLVWFVALVSKPLNVSIRMTFRNEAILRSTASIMRRGLGTIFNLTMGAVYGNILVVKDHFKQRTYQKGIVWKAPPKIMWYDVSVIGMGQTTFCS